MNLKKLVLDTYLDNSGTKTRFVEVWLRLFLEFISDINCCFQTRFFIKPKFTDLDVTCKYKELVFQELIAWQKVKNN